MPIPTCGHRHRGRRGPGPASRHPWGGDRTAARRGGRPAGEPVAVGAGLPGQSAGTGPAAGVPSLRAGGPSPHLGVHRGHRRRLPPVGAGGALAQRALRIAEAACPPGRPRGGGERGDLHDRVGSGARHGLRLRGPPGAADLGSGALATGHGLVAVQYPRRPVPAVVRPPAVLPHPLPSRDRRGTGCLRAGHRDPDGRSHRREEGAGRGVAGPPGVARHAHRASQPGLLLRPHGRGAGPCRRRWVVVRGHALRPRPVQGDQRHHGPPLRRPGAHRDRPAGAGGAAGGRHPGPPGWGRVLCAASRRRRPGGRRPGGRADRGRARGAFRGGRHHPRHRGQLRHRHGPG